MNKDINISQVHPKRLYSLSEAARILGRDRGTIRTYIAKGWIEDCQVAIKPKRGREGKTSYKRGLMGAEIQRIYTNNIL